MKLDTIYESNEFEDFLKSKNHILRILCVTEYAAYFYISININKHSIKVIINLGILGNFILFRVIEKFDLFKRRKNNPF